MITNFQKQSRKDDVKLLVWIVVGFLFIAWFCSPPGNKLLQLCFWGNNTGRDKHPFRYYNVDVK